MELSYNHLNPWSRNILNKVIEVYIMKKLCNVCVIRGFIIVFIKGLINIFIKARNDP